MRNRRFSTAGFGPPAVVHLDAHCDTWIEHLGEATGHGTWVHEEIQEGTGPPGPGGLGTAQAFTRLEELSALTFVGMEHVEVAPVYDHQEPTSLAAADRLDLAGGPRPGNTKLTHFAVRKPPPPLQLFRGKDCCESPRAMRC